MRAAARTTIRPDTASVNILAGSKHRFKNQQTIHSLNSMRRTATMCRTSYLQDRFAPSEQIIIDTNSPHTGKCSHTLLLVFTIATATEMSVRTDNQCMFSF